MRVSLDWQGGESDLIASTEVIHNNYSPHRHRNVKTWRRANLRFHFHFTPTYSSWLNPVEHWFSALQRQVLARGSFADAAALRTTLGRYVRGRNRGAVPRRGRPPLTSSWPGSHMYEELTIWCTTTTRTRSGRATAGLKPAAVRQWTTLTFSPMSTPTATGCDLASLILQLQVGRMSLPAIIPPKT